MDILCDTSCIMMLIRINPDMFIDDQCQCCTIQIIRNEIFQTQKFKLKYPWRDQFKTKINCLPNTLIDNEKIRKYSEVITLLIRQGSLNEKKGQLFDLSSVDIKILSCALGNGYKITTGDEDLGEFALQQFKEEFKGLISPLEIINDWIENRIIKWNDQLHDYLADWKTNNEHPQPQKQIIRFCKLGKRSYPGT